MKSIVPMITIVVLAISGGCGSSVEKEAVKRAKECWKLTQIGGSTYLCEITVETHPSGFGAVGTGASKTVFELRGIKLEVSASTLSEADKLNGVEWAGSVRLYSSFRRYAPQPYSGAAADKTWSDWRSAEPTATSSVADSYIDGMRVTKMKGKWEVVPAPENYTRRFFGPRDVTFKQVEPSDLPK